MAYKVGSEITLPYDRFSKQLAEGEETELSDVVDESSNDTFRQNLILRVIEVNESDYRLKIIRETWTA